VAQATHKATSTRPESAERFYLPELDVLRFFAFFGVFVWHVPLPLGGLGFYQKYGALGSVGTFGAFGVDLFFTLSGYLLTRLLLRERDETGDINLKAFYVRRTLRIWPLYYFSLAFFFLLSHLPVWIASAPPFIVDPFVPMRPISYFFLATFLFNFNFADCLFPSFMGHLWSISAEEQFYLFWPWFARYVPRRWIVVVPIAMIAISCIARAAYFSLSLHSFVWNNTFTRLDPIAVGILIALLPTLNPRPFLRFMLALLGFASWFLAAYYCGLPSQDSTVSISMGYPAVALGSGAFLLATLGLTSFSPSSAIVRCLIYLGKVSYGLYVYNTIAIFTAAILLYRVVPRMFVGPNRDLWIGWPVYMLLAFALNVALAAASYRWLEAPFLRLKQRFTRVPSRAV
jgi:peptidoglycan/LPS O-acetylase OafA/YrhL